MSFEDATSALEGAIDADNAPATLTLPEQATPASTTPEGETSTPQVQPHHASQQPRDPASGKFIRPDGSLSDTPEPAATQTPEDTFDGGRFNPDTLPPELQPGWKQLQAAFTQKTQEVAQQRAQLEQQFGDVGVVEQAVQLYTALQDPNYLQQFHSELTQALQKQGLSPAQAHAEAASQIEQAATPPSPGDPLAALRSDPELAPLADQFQALQQRLDNFDAQQAQARQEAELQQWYAAQAGELQRQEAVILTQDPSLGVQRDDGTRPLDAVYELAAFHGGNLLTAYQRLTDLQSEAVSNFVNQKSQATGMTPAGEAALSTQETPISTLEDGLDAALEYARQNNLTHLT